MPFLPLVETLSRAPAPAKPSNRDLVARCLAGEEAAWSALLDRYKRLIFSIPLKRGLSRDEAADVFQAVCLDLVTELTRLRNPDALTKWLIETTSHKCSKHHRRNDPLDAHEDVGLQRCASDEPLPETLLVEVQREQAVRQAIQDLPPRCRSMIEMLFFTTPARPYRDVAAELGLATGSIGFIRQRCLERLRSVLSKAGL
jgi:RNA polymerase sigma factor (sigma-70 family)